MTAGQQDARARLRKSALELFRTRGYDRTMAAAIATHAGVTKPTFFRHFPDKREVLFDGEATVEAALTAFFAQRPPISDHSTHSCERSTPFGRC